MNDSAYFERNDTGILSLADLFRRDRLPCRAEPKRWSAPGRVDSAGGVPPADRVLVTEAGPGPNATA